jgi:predicted ester cyclase
VADTALSDVYRAYIDCLNARDWSRLGQFVHEDAIHNGRPLGLSGYRAMLEQDVRDIPDLRFHMDLLVCDPPQVATRLLFDCTPQGTFLGLPVDGRRVAFAEHVIYRFRDDRIAEVWSILDKPALEAQL